MSEELARTLGRGYCGPTVVAPSVRSVLAVLSLAGCASSSDLASSTASELETADAGAVERTTDGGAADETQVPPVLTTAGIEEWLAKGHYKQWACEAIRPSRPPAGTAPTRVCSNAVLSAHGEGEYPVGSVDVREIFNSSATQMVGRAVIVKVAPGGGASWYWYEKFGANVAGSGMGDSGPSTQRCVTCHERANPTTLFGHDLVFNQIRPAPSR